jgi:4'-phosphopantetheinyl transferase EntD
MKIPANLAELIARIAPTRVGFAEAPVADHAADLYPEEAQRIAKAVEKRRREFATGRMVARRALVTIGAPSVAIPSGPHGEPIWPDGFIGSITHTSTRAAAAVGRARDFLGLGIDVEEIARMSLSFAEKIATGEEREQLRAVADPRRQLALLYSAKESWFKCQYPSTKEYLGFMDAVVQFDWSGGTFAIRPTREQAGIALAPRARGHFTFDDHHVATVVTLPA